MNLRSLNIEYDQDLIKEIRFQKGQNQRPLWKLLESCSPDKMILWVDRADSLCPIAYEWALAQALESSAEIFLSERSQFVRTVFSEINRLVYLTTYLGNVVKNAGLEFLYERILIFRENVFQAQEELMGGRILPQALKVGGVRRDLAMGDLQKVAQFIQTWRKSWRIWIDLIEGDRILWSRLDGLLPLSQNFVQQFGVWGICGKASRVFYDARLHQPHGAYAFLDMNLTYNFSLNGDGLSRFNVAKKEVEITLDILESILKKIHDETEASKVATDVKFKSGFFAGSTESAKGPVTAVLYVDKSKQIKKIKVFSVAQRVWPVIEKLFQGQKSEDFYLAWASLGFSGEEGEL